jgi:hypothetical protein
MRSRYNDTDVSEQHVGLTFEGHELLDPTKLELVCCSERPQLTTKKYSVTSQKNADFIYTAAYSLKSFNVGISFSTCVTSSSFKTQNFWTRNNYMILAGIFFLLQIFEFLIF